MFNFTEWFSKKIESGNKVANFINDNAGKITGALFTAYTGYVVCSLGGFFDDATRNERELMKRNSALSDAVGTARAVLAENPECADILNATLHKMDENNPDLTTYLLDKCKEGGAAFPALGDTHHLAWKEGDTPSKMEGIHLRVLSKEEEEDNGPVGEAEESDDQGND